MEGMDGVFLLWSRVYCILSSVLASDLFRRDGFGEGEVKGKGRGEGICEDVDRG